jgi:cytosine permease
MLDRLKQWWHFDAAAEQASADNPLTALSPDQRRHTLPLLTLAFGWGFLVTGLIVGGALGSGLPFDQIVEATFVGNTVNFGVGALVAYIGYRTACNSGMLYRFVYGTGGAFFPVIFLALITIGWQGIVIGAFGFAWVQSFGTGAFYAVAIFAGLLFTATTYFGVRGLELVSIPATFVLVLVGVYAGYSNVTAAGGWDAFMAMSETSAATAPLTMVQAINLVIGSWIIGAVVMPEYTRFAKKAWVAIAIPFIVLLVAQWFLQIIGAMGGIVAGTFDFTTYMRTQGLVIGGIGVVAMSLALWTTGDANLYLPVIQTSSVFKRPKRVMTVICGLLGTVLGLGIYQRFIPFIETLASIAPPLIGPLLVDFYIVNRHKYDDTDMTDLPILNPVAFVAYGLGVAATFYDQPWIMKAVVGLIASIVSYFVLYYLARAVGMNPGNRKTAAPK